MIILIGLCIYFTVSIELIPNDSIYEVWMKRMISYTNNTINRLVIRAENLMQISKRKKKKTTKVRTRLWKSTVIINVAVAMQAKSAAEERTIQFDTDSVPVGIDNRCSACISHKAEDFIGQLKDSSKSIKGFGGARTTNIKVGTLSWTWNDDGGKPHKFIIPNSYYVPSGKVRLLSQQHWAKTQRTAAEKKKSGRYGTLSQTTADDVSLFWNDRKSRLTVPLSARNNVASFYLAPGFNNYMRSALKPE